MTQYEFSLLVQRESERRGDARLSERAVMHVVLRQIAEVERRLKHHASFPGANEAFAQIRDALGLPEDL